MKFSTYVRTLQDIRRCESTRFVEEVLIEPALIAQQGDLTKVEVECLNDHLRKSRLKSVLVWDVLMTGSSFDRICQELRDGSLDCFGAVRVKDLGAAAWLQSNYPDIPLQLILEGSSHNLEAMMGWIEYFGNQLEKIVLSIELPEKKMVRYCKEVPVKFEVLGAGPILIFNSPRRLLSRVLSPEEDDSNPDPWLKSVSFSEESQNRKFATKQTPHGTLMFLDKDHFILDRLENLEASGIETVRIDLRDLSENGEAACGIERICQLVQEKDPSVRKWWPKKTLTPFFRSNGTTKQLKHLKSELHALRDESCLAQVISGEKGNHVVLYSLREFDTSQKKTMILPSGEELAFPDFEFRDSRGMVVKKCEADRVFVVPWIRKACNGALIKRLLGRV